MPENDVSYYHHHHQQIQPLSFSPVQKHQQLPVTTVEKAESGLYMEINLSCFIAENCLPIFLSY